VADGVNRRSIRENGWLAKRNGTVTGQLWLFINLYGGSLQRQPSGQ